MVQAEERQRLFETFVGCAAQDVTDDQMGELAWADVNVLAEQVLAMRGCFGDCALSDKQIASEIRHYALWLLKERRKQREDAPIVYAYGGVQ